MLLGQGWLFEQLVDGVGEASFERGRYEAPVESAIAQAALLLVVRQHQPGVLADGMPYRVVRIGGLHVAGSTELGTSPRSQGSPPPEHARSRHHQSKNSEDPHAGSVPLPAWLQRRPSIKDHARQRWWSMGVSLRAGPRRRRLGLAHRHRLRQRHPDQSRPPPQHHQPEPHQGPPPDHCVTAGSGMRVSHNRIRLDAAAQAEAWPYPPWGVSGPDGWLRCVARSWTETKTHH